MAICIPQRPRKWSPAQSLACNRALDLADASGPVRGALAETICRGESTEDQDRCCRERRHISHPIERDVAATYCGNLCFNRKDKEACTVFEGSEGRALQVTLCANHAGAFCAGLPPEAEREVQERLEQRQRIKELAAKERTEKEARGQAQAAQVAAERAAEAERQRRCLADPACAARQRPVPSPVASAQTARQRTSCQYMFLTGGNTGNGRSTVMRHFYDAADCGGVCCNGQSVCCADRRTGREFCSNSGTSGRADEPQEQSCTGAASFRDARRDDHTPVPVMNPGY